ncbi:MAG: four helix bundle protein, partial [Alphaproteobacteria bacterium]|nr:four helix bundle protein [Alphaproteobacteria bacterium]
MGSYRDLDVWKKSIQFAELIYNSTQDFPKSEIYGMVPQMRRAA